ncbi:MAG: histidine--tRNA ligase [Bacteroidaceae bacterium]|jgi:histidyl-tRNA synthetase|nr:histidine--tRNA ligase [Bacteroidaceae bacterium]MBR4295166.1 histidine--tRNA ligase [Bacteroidaceae bacterium]
MATAPSRPKGTRDFSPVEMSKRNYIFDTIRAAFNLFGFKQIETPAMENLSTLMGKYGEEGDKLLFKIQNSGDYFNGITDEELLSRNATKLASKFCEKGLRYDLTVPFARYVVMHRNDIVFPFKRYQIQPVWRADRPQKGRYREFYQCDADVIGSNSLLNEVELVQLIDHVFTQLKIRVAIKINNRKILAGIAEVIGEPEKIIDITIAIDKLDKIGLDGVVAELKDKGITDESIEKLLPILQAQGNNQEKLAIIAEVLKGNATGEKGVEEVNFILDTISSLSINSNVELDLTLARGLNYYTGAIFEVKALDVEIGSISGGGRYDNLTGVFGVDGMSGVGISFGADRIYDVMNQLNLYPEDSIVNTQVLFVNFGAKEAACSLGIMSTLRKNGISAEIYPEAGKMKKQMGYANSHNIPYVAIIGESEIENGTIAVKDMNSGEQRQMTAAELVELLKK